MNKYIPGDHFHAEVNKPYKDTLGWAINKKAERMAKVVYEAVHENPDETGIKRGHGKDFATWIFSEEVGMEEQVFKTGLELMIDARLEANAAIGLHTHHRTEEVYYMLEGSLTMTTVSADGQEHQELLEVGDAHAVTLGQGHYGVAGPQGARFIAVATH